MSCDLDLRATYETLHALEAGGMSEAVLAGRRRADGTPVAIKVVERGDVAEAEARALVALDHPGVVRLLDRGQLDGRPALVTALVDGETLQQRIEARGPLPVDETMRQLAGVAATLEHVHERGWVHADVKPSNLVLAADGPVLIDFGLALPIGEAHPECGGSPSFAAPEVIGASALEPRTDVYGLAATLFHALTGAWAYDGDSPLDVFARQLAHGPARLDRLDPLGLGALRPVFERAFGPRRWRPETPCALIASAARALAGEPATRRFHRCVA